MPSVKHFTLTPTTLPLSLRWLVGSTGLPLAIKLAAGAIKVFEPGVLLQQVNNGVQVLSSGHRDAPTRQRTLQAAIMWSYDLPDPQYQQALRRLGVFAGGFSAAHVEAVSPGAAQCLWRLVDDNLILPPDEAFHGEPRFRMLETIREFALEGSMRALNRTSSAPGMRRFS